MMISVLTYDLSFKVICVFEGKNNHLSGGRGSQLLLTERPLVEMNKMKSVLFESHLPIQWGSLLLQCVM